VALLLRVYCFSFRQLKLMKPSLVRIVHMLLVGYLPK
jgi:hypothetical protein